MEKTCRNCEHAFLETCKGCNTLPPNTTYENFELRKELANGIGDIEEAQSRIDELECQLAYECACNSQLLETEKQLTAETANWDTLCNKLGNIIAQGNDCENLCCQGFLDMVNEIKHYDGEYDRQLQAEKHRADVAEEALDISTKHICDSCTVKCCSENCFAGKPYLSDYFKQQAEANLKERV